MGGSFAEPVTIDMKRLMIIDEDTDVLDSLKLLLTTSYEICLARTGAEALTEMDSGFLPDGIIMDVAPSDAVPAFLKELDRRKMKVPVLALAKDPEAEERARKLDLGEALRMPFTYEQLKEKVERTLKSPGGKRSGSGFLTGFTLVAG